VHIPFTDIQILAQQVGLDDVGAAIPTFLEKDATFMQKWIRSGLHGEMHYLEKNRDKRYDPRKLVAGAQSIIIGVITYDHSGHDYHRTMKSMLYNLQGLLTSKYGQEIVTSDQHIFCDSAPFLERRWASIAGLGFIGKNHQLIHPQLGSKIHLGELVLQVDINKQDSIIMQQCADCSLCLEACPTGALRTGIWDSRQCIAYQTHHCLVCQDVCPFNQI